MKIICVYAQNLQIFIDAVEGTDCRLNASTDMRYLINSVQNFNARDMLGLIIVANPITRNCSKLIKQFDNFYMFQPKPIIVVSDDAKELIQSKKLRTKYAKLYPVVSEENTISDIDINKMLATLIISAGDIYDLSPCTLERPKKKEQQDVVNKSNFELSQSLTDLLNNK